MHFTDQEWRPVMPYGWQQQATASGFNTFHARTGIDAALDEEDAAVTHAMLRWLWAAEPPASRSHR